MGSASSTGNSMARLARNLRGGALAHDWFAAVRLLVLILNKLPFTCSHLPGKTPGWILALQGFAVITLVPVLQTALLATLYSALDSALILCALSVVWLRVHALRREGWSGLRLKFDEVPEPAVNGLRLLR
jgi:hypothetical protein